MHIFTQQNWAALLWYRFKRHQTLYTLSMLSLLQVYCNNDYFAMYCAAQTSVILHVNITYNSLSNIKKSGRSKLVGQGDNNLNGWAVHPNGQVVALNYSVWKIFREPFHLKQCMCIFIQWHGCSCWALKMNVPLQLGTESVGKLTHRSAADLKLTKKTKNN